MTEERTCKYCFKKLKQKEGESNSAFANRNFCNVQICSKKYHKDKPKPKTTKPKNPNSVPYWWSKKTKIEGEISA